MENSVYESHMGELHYRYNQSKTAGKQDGEQLGRWEAQCHSRNNVLVLSLPAVTCKDNYCCWGTAKEPC